MIPHEATNKVFTTLLADGGVDRTTKDGICVTQASEDEMTLLIRTLVAVPSSTLTLSPAVALSLTSRNIFFEVRAAQLKRGPHGIPKAEPTERALVWTVYSSAWVCRLRHAPNVSDLEACHHS